MIVLIAAFLATAPQDAQQETSPPPAEVQPAAAASAEPEKICRTRVRPTGQNGAAALRKVKVCKTKEEWDRMKSRPEQ